MSSLTPVRDDRSAPRDLAVPGSRARPHGCPGGGGVTRPRSVLYVALLRRGSSLGRAETKQQKDLRRKTPWRPRLTVLRRCRQTVALCAHAPSALSRPWQWTTLGLPAP